MLPANEAASLMNIHEDGVFFDPKRHSRCRWYIKRSQENPVVQRYMPNRKNAKTNKYARGGKPLIPAS